MKKITNALIAFLLIWLGYKISKVIWYQGAKKYVLLNFIPEVNPYYGVKVSELEKEKAKKVDVLVIGDSIPGRCQLNDYFNRGFDGDTVLGVTKRLDEALRFKPEKLIIAVGANDLLLGSSVESLFSRFSKLLYELKDKYSGQVFLHGVFPENEKLLKGAKEFNLKAQVINQKLEELIGSKYKDWKYIHFLPQNQGLSDEFTSDGEHLSDLGCEKWAEWLSLKI